MIWLVFWWTCTVTGALSWVVVLAAAVIGGARAAWRWMRHTERREAEQDAAWDEHMTRAIAVAGGRDPDMAVFAEDLRWDDSGVLLDNLVDNLRASEDGAQ